jgi:alkanesulfonate monooxygenase SsuD/methylene tetrahydromethanopterin reductase-like flavin-dependent oxidoreductase (luciferase family)
VGQGSPDPDFLRRIVTEAEDRGFDTFYFADVPSLPSTDPLLAVALAAGVTRRMKVGANFIPFGYQPFVFAHKLAQLDRLTAGRLLVTLVPGLDLPGERKALGTEGRHRGRLMDDLLPQLRDWWAGQGDPPLAVTPVQDPLEVWLGGSGPQAIQRAGRLSDGWLGSLVSPDRAGEIVLAIKAEAAAAGRTIDPEHFGLSIGYARRPEDIGQAVRLRRPRPHDPVNLTELIPIGADALRDLVAQLVDRGLSKFVVRPVAPVDDWSDELGWLASTVLDLQT